MYPTKYIITSGKGISQYQLVAFDNALLDAGISNYNLLKVSSILPANCAKVESINDLPQGSPLLTAFASISSNKIGEQIASAVAAGIPEDRSNIGVIMEYSAANITSELAEKRVKEMVREAMKNHNISLDHIESSSVDGIVPSEGFLSIISAISFW